MEASYAMRKYFKYELVECSSDKDNLLWSYVSQETIEGVREAMGRLEVGLGSVLIGRWGWRGGVE